MREVFSIIKGFTLYCPPRQKIMLISPKYMYVMHLAFISISATWTV